MFKVLDIRYKDGFISINFDTGESLNLYPDIFNMYTLEKGKLVDHIEYQQLKEESDRFNCKKKAIGYLSIRSRTCHELETYLYNKGFSKDIVKEVIAGLEESGYIDDYNYAVNYIHYKKGRSAVGENLLRRELYKKGVSRAVRK